jgi:hypothetical protein
LLLMKKKTNPKKSASNNGWKNLQPRTQVQRSRSMSGLLAGWKE